MSFENLTACNRMGPVAQQKQYATGNPFTYDGYVTACGPAEIMEGSAVVFIQALKSHVKCYVSEGMGTSSGGSGKSYPLKTGDRVFVQYLRGDVNAPHITGRVLNAIALADKVQQTLEIPQPGEVFKNIKLDARGINLIPEALDWGLAIPYEIVQVY